MKLTRRGLLAALGVAPMTAKVEAGVREQPKTKVEQTNSALWQPRGREMDVINSDAFETAFWGWPATGKTEAGLHFVAFGMGASKVDIPIYANKASYRGLVLVPSHMAAEEWMRRAKETYARWHGVRFTYADLGVQFGSGARIHLMAGVDGYLQRLRGCAFQQIVFDGWAPAGPVTYRKILEMARDYYGSMPPRVLIAARPQDVPRWALKRFGKVDGERRSLVDYKIKTVYAEDPVIEMVPGYTKLASEFCKFRC